MAGVYRSFSSPQIEDKMKSSNLWKRRENSEWKQTEDKKLQADQEGK